MDSVIRLCKNPYFALCVIYFLLFIICYVPWNGKGADDAFYYSHVASPLFDGDVEIANDIASSSNAPSLSRGVLARINSDTGRTIDSFACGNGLLWLPFIAPVRGVALLLDWAGVAPAPDWNWRHDRYSLPYLQAVSVGTCVFGCLTLLLIFETCRRRFSVRASFWAAFAAVGSTQLLGYAFAFSSMSHAHSAFAVALLTWVVYRRRHFRSLSDYALIGTALGLVTIIRWQDAVTVVIPAAFWLRSVLRTQRRAVGREVLKIAAGAAAFLAVFSLQSAFWFNQSGLILTMPQGEGFMQWATPHIKDVLFGGWNGLLYWHPLLSVGLAGLLMLALSSKPGAFLARVLLAVFAVEVYVNACVLDWTSSGFGARRFCSVVPLLAFGLAGVFHTAFRRPRWRFAPPCIVILATAVNLVFLAAFSRHIHNMYPWFSAWHLRDQWAANAGWLATVPMGSFVLANMYFRGGNQLFAYFTALGGGALFLVVLPWAVLSRQIRQIGNALALAATLGVCPIIAAWLIIYCPPPDHDALKLRKALDYAMPIPERDALIRHVLARRSDCVLAYLLAAESPDAQLRKSAIAGMYSVAPRLWAKWISDLPPGQASVSEKIAAAVVPTGVRDLFQLSMLQMQLSKRLSPQRQTETGRYLLRFYPLFPGILHKQAEWEESAGRLMAAQAARETLARIAEAQLATALRCREQDPILWAGSAYTLAGRHFLILRQRQQRWKEAADAGWIYLEAAILSDLGPEEAWIRRQALVSETHAAAKTADVSRLLQKVARSPGLTPEDCAAAAAALLNPDEDALKRNEALSDASLRKGIPQVATLDAGTRTAAKALVSGSLRRFSGDPVLNALADRLSRL